MTPKFKIGDNVFMARYDKVENFVTCPDCGGSKRIRVLLHDDTEISIACGGCDPGGYEPPTGRIKQYAYTVFASPYTVTGVKITSDDVSYELNNFGGAAYWSADKKDLFATVPEAVACGEIQKLAHEADENKRLMAKTKDAKSWAWNATYHRQCIKRLERDLEYHRSKVQICAAKANKEKAA